MNKTEEYLRKNVTTANLWLGSQKDGLALYKKSVAQAEISLREAKKELDDYLEQQKKPKKDEPFSWLDLP